MTNAEFVKTDQVFQRACMLAKVGISKRQASKFRRKKGLAFTFAAEAKLIIKEENKSN